MYSNRSSPFSQRARRSRWRIQFIALAAIAIPLSTFGGLAEGVEPVAEGLTLPLADLPSVRQERPDQSKPNQSKLDQTKPCVLLRNGSVLFGAASKIGDVVYIKRDDGSLIQFHASESRRSERR